MNLESEVKTKNSSTGEESPISSAFSFILIVILVFAFKSSVLDANNIPSGSMIPTLKIGDFLFVNKMRYSIRMPFTEAELIRIDDPKRGDIVTFAPPLRALSLGDSRDGFFAKRYVKRVVGLPGDTIRISSKFLSTKKGNVNYSVIEYKEKGSDTFQGYDPVEIEEGTILGDLDNLYAPTRSLFLEKKPGFEHYVLEGYEEDRKRLDGYECNFSIGCQIPENQYMVVGDNRDDSHDSRAWGFVKREDILGKALVIYFSINWKDNVCEYKSGKELSEKGPEFAERYQGEELIKNCHPSEIGLVREESKAGWIERTLRYRIWRMEVRWNRIGTILR
ncbi:signal peptidase I [Leptospira weilii str. 2006001853]|uniref:Signal peptidase I n=1 Tax=Leptospira weilii str. 2006001853 TaxID=1001589 RepID=A0A828Z6V1_9LEPT|nr:signal peptidase I [Leptospira weilii]EKR66109.1 signal peptidase I [Leptospira weilii str. 2006001853]EMN46614.1 signal peptidase I [Leptospira weilii str. LNT 1234]QDK23803.1 signal peptidase I [Leptospira weilii]QDK26560.1 signal peptidase I [Leptospira weilii]